jgi:hypothetical protein
MKVTEIIRERCECASFCSLSGVVRQIPLFRGVDFLGGCEGLRKQEGHHGPGSSDHSPPRSRQHIGAEPFDAAAGVEQLRRWAQSASRGDADASRSPKSLV